MDREPKIDLEPDWVGGTIYTDVKRLPPAKKALLQREFSETSSYRIAKFNDPISGEDPIQQSDPLKPFLLDICHFGLAYGKDKYYYEPDDIPPPIQPDKNNMKKTDRPWNVIVIGAGMSGLVAGYELQRAGHNITILERQPRIGGRVKTVGQPFFHKCEPKKNHWADTGAMRLPGTGKPDWTGPHHYLTDFYAQKFEIPVEKFINESEEAYYQFGGRDKPCIKRKEWHSNKQKYCDEFWPGWDARLPTDELKKLHEVDDIVSYFGKTLEPLVNQLKKWLKKDPHTAWKKWIKKWSQFRVDDFLTSSYDDIIRRLQESEQYDVTDGIELQSLKSLLPWPQQAVTAFAAYTYSLPLDVSLVWYISNDIGLWWKMPMHTYKDGINMLPEAFLCHLAPNIHYGVNVKEIKYERNEVVVVAFNDTTDEEKLFYGHKVIVSLPANLTRELKFTPPLPEQYQKAIKSIKTNPLIKTAVQCRTRFWNKEGIEGGFSKTDMDIGQLLYPSNPGFAIPSTERGLLMCYTWRSEPMLHTMNEKEAIAKVVDEISVLHPEIKDEFEVGYRQAWSDNDEGAYCIVKPEEYMNVMNLMMYPYKSIYFAGEVFSYSNGWIQGALESGLRAAYQVHTY